MHADPIYLAHIELEVWLYSYIWNTNNVRKNFHIFKKWQQKVSSAELSLAILGFFFCSVVGLNIFYYIYNLQAYKRFEHKFWQFTRFSPNIDQLTIYHMLYTYIYNNIDNMTVDYHDVNISAWRIKEFQNRGRGPAAVEFLES